MDDIDAELLRPLYEQLSDKIDAVSSGAYFELFQDAAGVQRIKANAAGFVCAGLILIGQGLNCTGLSGDQPLLIDLDQFTIEKDKTGWLIDPK